MVQGGGQEMAMDDEVSITETNVRDSSSRIVIDLNETSHQEALVLPPPKWKYFCILFPLIFLISWLEDLSGVVPYVVGKTGFNIHFMVFCIMVVNITVFTYSTLSFVPWLLNITINGKSYGITWWLKQERLAPKCNESSSFFLQLIGCFLEIFEDGFQIFDMGWYKSFDDDDGEENGDDHSTLLHFRNNNDKENYNSSDKEVVVHFEYIIDPTKVVEFNELCDRTDSILRAKGVKRIVRSQQRNILSDDDDNDEEEGNSDNNNASSVPKPRRGMLKRMSSQLFLGGLHQDVEVVFHKVDNLNQWLASREREKCMKQIKPLLMKPHHMTLQDERQLPDVFTDLLVPQGLGAPGLNPKKWKVASIVIFGFFFSFVLENVWWLHYSVQWFPNETMPEMLSGMAPGMLALNLAILVAFFMYIMEPFMMYLFAPWLVRKRNENDTNEPWRTLNDGLESMWIQAIITLIFYFTFFALYAGFDWKGIPPLDPVTTPATNSTST